MSSDSPQDSSSVRNDSEDFRSVPQSSEAFRTVPNDAEARESHTLTVKEVARMFEDAGVARTERSVVNWCRRDAAGASRLDSYFDPNERKHFITPESVDRAIQEELAKVGAGKEAERLAGRVTEGSGQASQSGAQELRLRNRDLEISNRAKDLFIEKLEEDRAHFVEERTALIGQLSEASRIVGKLEEQMRQLKPPEPGIPRQVEPGTSPNVLEAN